MADFNVAIEKILEHEGGYVDDPIDRGGKTKYGISHLAYPDIDIVNLTLEQAKAIYKKDYWDRLNLDRLDNQKVAEAVFDTAVNCGTGIAGKMLQRVLNYVSDYPLRQDGIIGEKTLFLLKKVLANVKPAIIIKLFNSFRIQYYLNIVDRDNKQKKFLKGWLNRVEM